MTAYEIARAIYAHHRRRRITAPTWDELTPSDRHRRTEAAKQLLEAYARPLARESRL